MKKFGTILALTGLIANLSMASLVFAQTSGSQTISCNPTGTTSLTATTSVTFETRTTNFYLETDSPLSALLDGGLQVDVTDTRGYDPTGLDCEPPGTPDAAEDAFNLQIQSDGLISGATTLELELGDTLTGASVFCYTVCTPSTVSDVATVTGLSDTLITTAQNIVTFDESFAGTIRTRLQTTQLQVRKPTSFIPTGTYTGTIVFSLV
jgi:hypothetical protein